VAGSVHETLADKTPPGQFLVADTAFPRGTRRVEGKIKAPLKENQALSSDPVERDERLRFDRQLLSCRQTSEWGMHAIQGAFGRLRVPLPADSGERRSILHIISQLYNLRVREIGLNQIQTVYCPIWQEDDGDRVWDEIGNMMFGDIRKNDRVARFHIMAEEVE